MFRFYAVSLTSVAQPITLETNLRIVMNITVLVRFETSRRMNAIKSSRAISRVNAELKTNVSETGHVSIIRVNVRKD
jgi:phospholipase/lecithinase/hemolysin